MCELGLEGAASGLREDSLQRVRVRPLEAGLWGNLSGQAGEGVVREIPELAREARVEHAAQHGRTHRGPDGSKELRRCGRDSELGVIERVLHREREDGERRADSEPGRHHSRDERGL